MNEKIMKQEATYDWLKDEVHCLYAEKKELQQRIDKAIEYIKQYGNLYCLKGKQFKDYQQYQDLLDILKGSDKE